MAEASPTTTPEPFTPANDASATLQAQHTLANDHPTDVNNNAVLARSQALTVDIAGKMFQSNADRRDKMADAAAGIFKTT